MIEYFIEVLSTGTALRMGNQVLITGTEWSAVVKELIKNDSDVPRVNLIDVWETKHILKEKVRTVVSITTFVAERKPSKNRFLMGLVEK